MRRANDSRRARGPVPRLAALAIAGAFIAAAGCDLLKSRQNDQVFWALQTGQVTAERSPSATVVRVRSVSAPSPISSAPLVYRYADGKVRADAYNAWISPIATLATTELQQALRSSGGYAGVLGPTDPGEVWAELQVSFQDASAHFEDGPNKAFARVSAVITWMGGDDQDDVIRQRVITKDVPIQSDSAQSVVEAINAAWTAVVIDVVQSAPVRQGK